MNYTSDCPHCGHRITAYTVHMNRPLALAFLAFCDARMRLGRPVEKGEIGLSNSQYSNFMILRHFNLIFQLEKGRAWEFNPLGILFLEGKASVLSPAAHFGGETLGIDHHAWSTHPHKRQMVSLQQVLPEEWKRREEFAAEKSGSAV